MARARLLRQYLQDYQKRLEASNADYQARYDKYMGHVNAYNAAAEKYNTIQSDPSGAGIGQIFGGGGGWIKPQPWMNTNAILDPETGRMYNASDENNKLSGFNWLTGGTELTWDELGKTRPEEGTPLMVQNPEYGTGGEPFIYQTDESGNQVAVPNPDYKITPAFIALTPGTPEYSAELAKQQKGYDDEKALVDIGAVKYVRNPVEWEIDQTTGKTYQNRYAESGQGTFRVYAAPNQPAEPADPQNVRPLNLTERNIRELRSPSQDMAGMQMSANVGLIGKSELVGNETAGPGSAFADPDDPHNLKEKGILAQVLGGQL